MFQRQSGYLWWKFIALLARCRRSFWHDLRKREGGRGETFWKTPVLWKTFGGARDKQKGGNTSSQCWSPRQIWPWTTGKKQQICQLWQIWYWTTGSWRCPGSGRPWTLAGWGGEIASFNILISFPPPGKSDPWVHNQCGLGGDVHWADSPEVHGKAPIGSNLQ